MKATKGGGDGFPKAPPGNHPAVLVAIIDLGTQRSEYQGVERWQWRAYFCWELVTEAAGPGRNHLIGIDLTLSFAETAKLRQWVEARTGKKVPDGSDFDPLTELGQPCLLNVIQKGDWPKINNVSPVPRGVAVPAPGYTPVAWSLDAYRGTGRIDLPDWLPWLYGQPLAEHIRQSREIAGTAAVPDHRPSAPPGPAAPAPPPPPPPRPPQHPAPPNPGKVLPPADDSRWRWHDPAKGVWVAGTAVEFRGWAHERRVSVAGIYLLREGATGPAKLAPECGFDDIPF